jgi:hypothetical protein
MRRFLLAAAAALLAAGAIRAQTTGSIDGRLTDSGGGALAGAVVTARSPSLQGTRTVSTDQLGQYRIPGVPPGEYLVRAAHDGFRLGERVVVVRLDATARVDLVLEPVVAEKVLVEGRAPAIDFASTTGGTNYESEVISRLPLGRNYADIVRSNPGVSTDRGATEGRSLALTIYGATSAENQWIIDGVNTTNPFKGIQGKAINNEFIQEVEVKTGGYQPEYGRALGGVVNVVTKSGGNAYHGDGFVYYDSTATSAEPEFRPGDSDIATMRTADGHRLDYGVDVGGFLVRDRLWIFGAYDRVELRGDLSRVESTALVSRDDRFPFDSTESLYSGKLTWNASPSTSVVGTVFADPSSSVGAAGADPRQGLGSVFVTPIVSPDPSTWFSARDQGGTDFGLRGSQLFGSRAIATIQGGYHENKNVLTAPDGIRYEDWTCAGGTPDEPCVPPEEANSITGGYGLISGLGDRSESSRRQYRGDVTVFAGSHELKAGGDYEDGRTRAVGSFTGGQLVEVWNEFGQLYYIHQFNAVSQDDPTPVPEIFRSARVLDFGAYVQDSWRAAPGLTINAGVRWDGERAITYADQTVLRLGTWQPRLGVIWDPRGDGSTRLYGFAGRFSYAFPSGMTAGVFANNVALATYNLDRVSVEQDPDVLNHGETVTIAGAGPQGVPVDSDVVSPYQDELTLGIERAFGSRLTVGLRGTYRRLGSAIENRCDLDRRAPENARSRCAIVTPGSDGAFAQGNVPTCNGLIDNPDWSECGMTGVATPPARRIYRGIELLARETVGDRLWIQASYVYSSLRGNYDGGVNQGVEGRSVPGRNQDFDYPALWHDGYGILTLDRPHRLRVDGYWNSPWRVSIGLQAFVESGSPLNRLGYFNFNYGSLVFLVPRGSEGRLPPLWDADLTLAYPIALGPVTVTLQAYLFHAFNKQIAIARDEAWSISPGDDQPATIYDPNQTQDNDNYGSVIGRSPPRSFRAAVRVSF